MHKQPECLQEVEAVEASIQEVYVENQELNRHQMALNNEVSLAVCRAKALYVYLSTYGTVRQTLPIYLHTKLVVSI